MAATDTALLLLCAGLTLLGVLITGLAWRRGSRGRVLQGVALTLAPVALYLSGLLGLLWDAAVAVGRWASALVLSSAVWLGLGLLGVSLVLFVVGGLLAKRRRAGADSAVKSQQRPAVVGPPATGKPTAPAKNQPRQTGDNDDDMSDIEALLKSRGIE